MFKNKCSMFRVFHAVDVSAMYVVAIEIHYKIVNAK